MTVSPQGSEGVSGDRGPLLLSVSGMGRLTNCELKFCKHMAAKDAGYDPDKTKGYGATLGTLLHLLIRETMFRRDWRPKYDELLAAETVEVDFPGFEPDAPEHFLHAEWLMTRWAEVHSDDPFWTLAAEIPFDLPLPGMENEVRVRGWIDGLNSAPPLEAGESPGDRPHGLFLDEIKSMGRWDKSTRVRFEPQCPTYLWAAWELHMPVTGVLFRAIGTMHKRKAKTPAPAADSFRDIWVPAEDLDVDKVLDDYRRTARRGFYILEHPEDAVRNPGDGCKWCPFKKGCIWPADGR